MNSGSWEPPAIQATWANECGCTTAEVQAVGRLRRKTDLKDLRRELPMGTLRFHGRNQSTRGGPTSTKDLSVYDPTSFRSADTRKQ